MSQSTTITIKHKEKCFYNNSRCKCFGVTFSFSSSFVNNPNRTGEFLCILYILLGWHLPIYFSYCSTYQPRSHYPKKASAFDFNDANSPPPPKFCKNPFYGFWQSFVTIGSCNHLMRIISTYVGNTKKSEIS